MKYILINNQEILLKFSFYRIEDLKSGSATGVVSSIKSMFNKLSGTDDKDYKIEDHLIGFGADGASVNFGRHSGVYTQMKEDMPWLVGVHCIAHKLELAAKDCFRNTFFTTEVCYYFKF